MSSLFFIFFVIPLLTIEGQRCQAFFAFKQFVVFSYLHLKEEGKTGDIWQHTIVINSSEILNQNYGQIIVASNITYIFKCSEKLFSYRVLTNQSCNPYSHSSEYRVKDRATPCVVSAPLYPPQHPCLVSAPLYLTSRT